MTTERLQTLKGYGLLWTDVADRETYRIRFKRGAFLETIAGGDIQGLLHHDHRYPIARQKNGSMSLSEDSRGLRVTYNPNNTTAGQNAVKMVRAGDVRGLSVGFKPVDFEIIPPDKKKGEKTPLLLVEKAELLEVSIVCWAAMSGSSITVELTVRQMWERDQKKAKDVSPEVNELREILSRHKQTEPQVSDSVVEMRKILGQHAASKEALGRLELEFEILNRQVFAGQLKRPLLDLRHNNESLGRFGLLSDGHPVISLDPRLSWESQRQVLAHEMCHMKLWQDGIEERDDHGPAFVRECELVAEKLGWAIPNGTARRWPFDANPAWDASAMKCIAACAAE